MKAFDIFLWAVFPYLCMAAFVGGLIWRYRTDKFGWTTRSSELHEHAMLRAASPMFHIGILMVAAGHLMGLAFPASWTDAVGLSHEAYHLVATIGGSFAALLTLLGLAGLIHRRIKHRAVFMATTLNDKIMYIFLAVPIVLGTWATLLHQVFGDAHGYDYRSTISPWFRSLFILQPDIPLMADVPMSFKLHILAGFALFMVWPLTRLVHALTPPVGYLVRPAIVYRSRDVDVQTTKAHRGWDPVDKATKGPHEAKSRGA